MDAPPSSLRVVIVGAGFCGLTAAIECKLRGLHPILVEAYSSPSSHGDLLDFVPNAAKTIDFFNASNELLQSEPWPQATDFQHVYAGHRGEMHEIIYDFVKEIGVELLFSKRVPLIREVVKNNEDTVRCWVGRDMHGFIYTWKNGKDCAWVLTHLDESDIAESWSEKALKKDVHYYLNQAGFPDVWNDTVDITPEERLIDYKLVWRELVTAWLSASKKCAVLGDAAHCHLPTSAQGACQAVEDAVTAAMCLQKCGGDVALGLQVDPATTQKNPLTGSLFFLEYSESPEPAPKYDYDETVLC
ncbi:Asperlicin C monooxygenase [Penicillium cf. viridicatum]|uniref:Asperlicin C monooxygenase n=1 Tax=Penicillium cf. viridicatum TaxID=2972119 RepID=A0A9W9N5D5_9EURO|nr:Asperlicin C monooxygenase [Penicillium cf. viridicatum]